jgi:putative transposase
MDASMVRRMKGMEEDNRRLKRMYSDLSMQNDLLKESPRNKVDRPSQRREIAETALERRSVSIALACRAFGVSETCYSYSPKSKDGNEVIADLLTWLTDARTNRGFSLCFLHLFNFKGYPWNHKRHFKLELNLRIKPRKPLKREKRDALAVSDAPNVT